MTEEALDPLRQRLDQNDRFLIVIAGPNGAGKSTFFETFLDPEHILFVNADLIARTIKPDDPGAIAYEAAAVAEAERKRLVAGGASFCMETVFSDPAGAKLGFLRAAQAAGYTLFLVFIGIDSAELAIGRVIQRVEDGGHDVPDEKIRSRFPRTLANLREAVRFVDYAYLLDNSVYNEPYRHVATFEGGTLTRCGKITPLWAAEILDLG
jgi:predicted ABC-type ATPase